MRALTALVALALIGLAAPGALAQREAAKPELRSEARQAPESRAQLQLSFAPVVARRPPCLPTPPAATSIGPQPAVSSRSPA